MKEILIYCCLVCFFVLFSCSKGMTGKDIILENAVTETFFFPTSSVSFVDVYEDPFPAKTTVPVSDIVSQIRYIIYDEAGTNVEEKVLTEDEIRNGFRVTLPAGAYQMCVLGEGRIVNYVPIGYPLVEIQTSPVLGGVWIAAAQKSRAPVYHDYFFTGLSFIAGSPGVKSIVLKRITGLLQVDLTRIIPDIILDKVSIGFLTDCMYNNFHTDGNYSFSGQTVESTSPYAIFHTLRYNPETGYYEGVYFPTRPDNAECTLIVSYIREGRVLTRYINLSDLPVRVNQRTRLPLVLE